MAMDGRRPTWDMPEPGKLPGRHFTSQPLYCLSSKSMSPICHFIGILIFTICIHLPCVERPNCIDNMDTRWDSNLVMINLDLCNKISASVDIKHVTWWLESGSQLTEAWTWGYGWWPERCSNQLHQLRTEYLSIYFIWGGFSSKWLPFQ